jgi:uncharacterized protein YdaU (DUF1376 family)
LHYYQFNIGDYRRDTVHLTLLEHGIYRSLLDSYYLNGSLSCENDASLMRSHSIRTEEEKTAFNNVIKDFFKKTKKGYSHKKCDEAIAKYAAKSDKARLSAKVRWDATAVRSHSESNANHKPITNNHKPIKTCLFEVPDWVNQKAFQEFVQHRKEMNKPFTDLSKTKVCNKLKGFTDDEQQTAINTSIESRWAGVFPKKLNGNNYEAAKNNHARPESNLARFSRKIQADIAAEDPFE